MPIGRTVSASAALLQDYARGWESPHGSAMRRSMKRTARRAERYARKSELASILSDLRTAEYVPDPYESYPEDYMCDDDLPDPEAENYALEAMYASDEPDPEAYERFLDAYRTRSLDAEDMRSIHRL